MAELAAVYFRLVGARIRSQFQYRVSFALDIAGAFCLTIIDFLAVIIIFQHLPRLDGWTLGEIAFLYGSSYVAFKLTDLVIGHIDGLPVMIQTGQFDMVLVRPLGSLFQVISSDIALRQLGSVAQGLVVLGYGLRTAGVEWTAGKLVVFATMPVSGALIFAAVWVAGATSTFWTVRTMELLNAFTYGGNMLTTYPISIFGAWFRRLFAFVIPLAFVNYFPALYLLDKPNPVDVPGWVRWCSPLVAAGLCLLAWRVWQFGVRHYRSTGS